MPESGNVGTAEDRIYKYIGRAAMIIGLCALAPIAAWLFHFLSSPAAIRHELLQRTDHREIALACQGLLTNRAEWRMDYVRIPSNDPRMPPLLRSVVRGGEVVLASEDDEVWICRTCAFDYIGFVFRHNGTTSNRFDLVFSMDVRSKNPDDILLYSVSSDNNAEPPRPREPSSAGASEGR